MTNKRKKSKLTHPKQHGSTPLTAELSQAEVWDDSALIRSWNDAVKEYEYYHSLHAKGEDVEEVLRRAEQGQEEGEVHSNESESEGVEEGELEEGEVGGHDDGYEDGQGDQGRVKDGLGSGPEEMEMTNGIASEPKRPSKQQDLQLPAAAATTHQTSTPNPLPSPATEPPTDQALENIKMAYYWAGYYSGLYDGQRQQASNTHLIAEKK